MKNHLLRVLIGIAYGVPLLIGLGIVAYVLDFHANRIETLTIQIVFCIKELWSIFTKVALIWGVKTLFDKIQARK
jgi:hypothetical protein